MKMNHNRKIKKQVSVIALTAALALSALGFAGCTGLSAGISSAGSSSAWGSSGKNNATADDSVITLDNLPDYDGIAYVELEGNQPDFSDKDKTRTDAFETYSKLDRLGRCGVAYANICQELMPTEKRGEIGSVRPSGWHTVNYHDLIDGNYLYNRCHLIGYQLAGENANEKNLITGTRYLNVTGMLPFEDQVADYVDSTDNHVLYRVTPIFEGKNLVASGVEMEAYSVEDSGKGVCFHIYCYNVQPGITIDYATGDSYANGESTETRDGAYTGSSTSSGSSANASNSKSSTSGTYVLNTNSKKFHKPTCSSVGDISAKNKKTYTGSRQDLINQGYTACGRCKP